MKAWEKRVSTSKLLKDKKNDKIPKNTLTLQKKCVIIDRLIEACGAEVAWVGAIPKRPKGLPC